MCQCATAIGSGVGFRFWQDVNADGRAQTSELGLVVNGSRTDIDFWVYRDPADSTLWLVPEFTGTQMRLYSTTPLTDLTSIDFAPLSGYSRNMIQAVPGYGYVFEIVDGSTLRYGALRVTHVGDAPLRLLRAVRGLELVELPDAEECCGFGGTFAVKNADTSMAMLSDKVRYVLDSRAEVCTSADNSCLMHIGGGLRHSRAGVRVMHVAEILAMEDA